jgi:ABC-2 type transport system permease protein
MGRPRELEDFRLRVSAVATKEAGMLLRQPRLLAVLLAGPVLIMVIFALSFHFHFGKPRVAVVVEPGSPGAQLFSHFKDRFRSQVNIELVTGRETKAQGLLQQGKLDGVVVVPPRPLARIESGRQATIKVRYRSQNQLFGYVVPSRANSLVHSLNQLFVRKMLSQELDALRSSRGELRKLNKQLGELGSVEKTLTSPQARRTTSQLQSTLNNLENTLSTLKSLAPDGLHTRVSNALENVRKAERLVNKVQKLERQAQSIEQSGRLTRLHHQLSELQQATSRIPPGVSASLLASPT